MIRRRPHKQLVRLHTTTDQTFEGVLLSTRGGHYVLGAAQLLRAGADPSPLTGTVYVRTEQVLFLQAGAGIGGAA